MPGSERRPSRQATSNPPRRAGHLAGGGTGDGATPTLPAETTAPAPSPVTRIEDVANRQRFEARDIRRGIWRARARRFGDLAAWLLLLLVIAVIVILGMRPAPTDFDSIGRYLI